MPKAKQDIRRVTVYLSRRALEEFRAHAEKQGLPYAYFIRKAMEEYLRRLKSKEAANGGDGD